MILLDTHVLLWLDCDDASLGPICREAIQSAWQADGVAVSSISFWEAAMLQQRGRSAQASGATLVTADAAILAWPDPLPRLNARH